MDSETNKAIVRRYIEMWNTGNVALADEVLAPAWMDHAHPEVAGIENVKQAVKRIRGTFPNFHISIEHILSEGDIVALRVTVQTATASRIMWFVRVIEEKMVEMWTGSEIAG